MKVDLDKFPGKSAVFLGGLVRAFKGLPRSSLYVDVFQQVNSRFGPENFAHKEPTLSGNVSSLVPKKFGVGITSKEILRQNGSKVTAASFVDFLSYCRANAQSLKKLTENSPLVCLGAGEQFRDSSFDGGGKKLVPITYSSDKEQFLDLVPDEGDWASNSQFLVYQDN